MYSIMYKQIVNPATGRKVNVDGKIGKQVLQQYKEQLGGEPTIFGHPFGNPFRKPPHPNVLHPDYAQLQKISEILGPEINASELKDIPDSKKHVLNRLIELKPEPKEEHLKHIATHNLPDYIEPEDEDTDYKERRIRILSKIKIPERIIKIGIGESGDGRGGTRYIKEFIEKLCYTYKRKSLSKKDLTFFKKNSSYINKRCYEKEISSDDREFWGYYNDIYDDDLFPVRMRLTKGSKYLAKENQRFADDWAKHRIPVKEEKLDEDKLKIDRERLKNYILDKYTIVVLKPGAAGVVGNHCTGSASSAIKRLHGRAARAEQLLKRGVNLTEQYLGNQTSRIQARGSNNNHSGGNRINTSTQNKKRNAYKKQLK